MFPLFETIRVEHGRVSNLTYHWARISHSCREIFGCDPKFQLDAILANEAVKYSGLHRLKFSYNPEQYQTEVAPYAVRAVESLKLVVDNEIPYQHKFSDRSRLEALQRQRAQADDVLIVKNGLITDAAYANIVFRAGYKWITPAMPLLSGTMRQHLIDQGIIEAQRVEVGDLSTFESFKLINAMLRFDFPERPISAVIE
ncbi:MAG: aminotransferase class IV [Cyclobacteriaceae bacterium]|jgi:4-amino-4-deoxychorismate lyase